MPFPIRSVLPRSFRGQLALSFALLGAALAILLSAALGSALAQRSRHEAGTVLHTVAFNAARLLSDGLDLRLREVKVLAASPTLWSEGLGSQRVAQSLYRSQAINPFSAWLGVADVDGVVRSASGGMLVGANVASRPWFAAGLKAPFVGDVHAAKLLANMLPRASDGGPQRFVDFSAPVHHKGQLLGVIGIHGSWEWTQATIESLLPPRARRDDMEVFVFDRKGQMIYAPDGALNHHLETGQGLPVAVAPLAASAAASAPAGAAQVAAWRDGKEYLTASAVLPASDAASDLGWVIVARQPAAVAHAAAREGAAWALGLGLAAAALAAMLGWWLAGELTLPLRRIAADAQALGRAEDAPPALPRREGSREVEQLSDALSEMTQRLLQSNAELEQRVRDRTIELERANAELGRLADHDPLTGLLNRRGFDERLAAALSGARRRKAPLSMLVVDADHFKRVNDQHGHDVGDQVLKTIAQVLRRRLREVDIVARTGGEEFVVVLADTGEAGASHVATALVAEVRATAMPVAGQVTISCGVAELDVGREASVDALRRADQALYRAKQEGRDRICVAPPAEAPEPLPSALQTA